MAALRYLEPAQISVERPNGAVHLRVTITDDRCILAARIKRAFPLSNSNQYLSIQDSDGKEVAILRTTEGLPSEAKVLLDEELDRRYFTPQIQTIKLLRQEAGMWKFEVATQRGDAEFYVRNWRDSAFELTPGRWQIQTVDGQRYEIMNLDALDAKSQKFLELLL